MPTQDNCDDLKVESCVDDKGQTINGGDSYDVPTGRYVKHVVNVCGTGGSAAGGLKTTACPNGGLEETWSGPDEVCLSIATEPDSALVLDGGVLKIDSTKIKVTSDNVLPPGSDPGLLSTLPVFTDPDGNTWNNQSDYNKWLYEDQKRQDEELNDALYQDPDDCGSYTAVDGMPRNGEIQIHNFNGATRIEGTDQRFENSPEAEVKVTYEDGSVYILTPGAVTGDAPIYFCQYNELIPSPPVGSTVQFCLIDVGKDTVYVTHEELEADQKRQDDATRNAVVVLEAEILALAIKTQEDQQRQDDEWAEDQKRQDEAIDDIEKALYGSTCTPGDITTELVFGHYSIGDDVTKAYWTPDYIKLPDGKQWGWFNPGTTTYCPEALYINGVEHKVTRGSNVSGTEWKYHLATEPDAALAGEIVTISQCPNTLPLFVTQPDQTRQDEEIEKRVLKAGDTMTGNLIVKADVHADRVETRNVDSGENSNLQLKHDGTTKVYIGGTEVTVQSPLKLNTEGVESQHAVTKGYIDSLDAKQAAEINTIQYKLDALLGLTFQGTYEFKHDQTCEERYQECVANCTNDARCEQDCIRDYSTCEQNNVDPGFFEAIDPDGQFDHLQEIIISKNDKSGIEIDWAGVLKEGDYLEVDHVFAGQLDKTNYGLYRITEEPVENTNSKGEKTYDLKLTFLQGDGVLNPQELYEIRGITAAEGVNPEELGDFLTKDDAAALYAPLSHTHNDYLRTDFSIYQEVG